MTVAKTTFTDGMIINKCSHCATYCVFALSDLKNVLVAGKRPQIMCHHCQALYVPGPPIDISDKGLPRGENNPTPSEHIGPHAKGSDRTYHETDQVLHPDMSTGPQINRKVLFFFAITCTVGALYWLEKVLQLNISDIFSILE